MMGRPRIIFEDMSSRESISYDLAYMAGTLAHCLDVAPARVLIMLGATLPQPTSLRHAYGVLWKPDYVVTLSTPYGFPRADATTMCPSGTRVFIINLIVRDTPGMGSHHGYKGYCIGLLWPPDGESPCDVRCELAD